MIVIVIATVLFGTQYYFKSKEVRTSQTLISEFSRLQNTQGIVNGLVNESLEYSKSHPAIDPILESIGAKPSKTAPAATTKPAGK